MKAAYDTTMDVYYGPSSPYGPPGTQYASAVPCRIVPQREIVQVDFPLSLSSNWLTHDNPPHLNEPKYTSQYVGQWQADMGTSDRVAVPTGTSPQWSIVRIEDLSPFGQTPYSRCLLVPLSSIVVPPWLAPSPPVPPPPPPPPPPPAPGSSCITAPIVPLGYTFSYNSSISSQQWLSYVLPSGFTKFRVVASKPSAVGSQIVVWVGTGCPSLTIVGGSYAWSSDVVPISPGGLWVEMPADPSWAPEPWDITVTAV